MDAAQRVEAAGEGTWLPANLRQPLAAELRRATHPPYEAPVVVMINGLLLLGCWTLLPASVVGELFRFHGPLAFGMVLAVWMYSDVPATNLLGADADRSIPALADRAALRRMWYAKNLVLWLLATPPCVVVAVLIGVHEQAPLFTVLTVLWIAVVPLGALGFANWLGIWFPYHPLPLRYRWTRRRRWRPMLARWAILVLAPYGLVPLLTVVFSVPSLVRWSAVSRGGGRIRASQFGWGLLVAAAVTAAAWPLGHRYGLRQASHRGERLIAFLADPDRG
jgi:hypothetical protein